MKSVREELAEALDGTLHSCCTDDRGPPPCAQCRITMTLLARHAAEPDDRPRLLALRDAVTLIMNDPSEEHHDALALAYLACADIATEPDPLPRPQLRYEDMRRHSRSPRGIRSLLGHRNPMKARKR